MPNEFPLPPCILLLGIFYFSYFNSSGLSVLEKLQAFFVCLYWSLNVILLFFTTVVSSLPKDIILFGWLLGVLPFKGVCLKGYTTEKCLILILFYFC